MAWQATTFNELVAYIDGEFVMLDDLFDFGNGFKGATGTTYRPIDRDDYDYFMSDEGKMDHFEELWRIVVADGGTILGLEEWVAQISDDEVFSDQLYDDELADQFRAIMGATEDEVPIFQSASGGRIFPECLDRFDAERGDKIVRPDLVDLIRQYERRDEVA